MMVVKSSKITAVESHAIVNNSFSLNLRANFVEKISNRTVNFKFVIKLIFSYQALQSDWSSSSVKGVCDVARSRSLC